MEWDPADRAKALAFMLEKACRCVMCGTADWEWDPAQGGKKFAYEAVARTCRGCEIKDAASDDTQGRPGVTIELHPTGTIESARRLMRTRDLQARRQGAGPARKSRTAG